MPSHVLLGEVRCQLFISVLVVALHVILYLTSTLRGIHLLRAGTLEIWVIISGTNQELLPGQIPLKTGTVIGESGPSRDCVTAFPSFPGAGLPQTMSFVGFSCYFPILTHVGVFLEKRRKNSF